MVVRELSLVGVAVVPGLFRSAVDTVPTPVRRIHITKSCTRRCINTTSSTTQAAGIILEAGGARPGAGFMKPCALLKLEYLTNAMHLLYALVRKSSFSMAQGFMKPAPDH